MIYVLDLLGTFAFAFLGARFGLQQNYNSLGLLCFAALTAVGGGTIRELFLNHTPFYLLNYTYLYVILAGTVAAYLLARHKHVLQYMLLLDALGTVVFAFIGTQAAVNAHLGLPAMVLCGSLTAFGGGLLCEIIAHKPISLFKNSFALLPTLGIATFCAFFQKQSIEPLLTIALFATALLLQICILYKRQLRRLIASKLRRFIRLPLHYETN